MGIDFCYVIRVWFQGGDMRGHNSMSYFISPDEVSCCVSDQAVTRLF